MKSIKLLSFSIVLFFLFSLPSFSQYEELEAKNGIKFETGLRFLYLSRTIQWDDEEEEEFSPLKSYLFSLNAGFAISKRISVNAFVGYLLTRFDQATFRQLPFSLILEEEASSGFVLGSDIELFLVRYGDFEIKGKGEFSYFRGREKEWEIPGLAVSGSATGKPTWMRIVGGPVIVYKGFDYFYPYFVIAYNHLWGKYAMDQTIQDLTGSEEKKFSSAGNIGVSLGAIYEAMDRLTITAEMSMVPNEETLDLGIHLGVSYSFTEGTQ